MAKEYWKDMRIHQAQGIPYSPELRHGSTLPLFIKSDPLPAESIILAGLLSQNCSFPARIRDLITQTHKGRVFPPGQGHMLFKYWN